MVTNAMPSGGPGMMSVSTTPDDGGGSELLAPYCTLDEPVKETIMRDLRAVGSKLKVVLLPLDRNSRLGRYANIGASSPRRGGGNNPTNDGGDEAAGSETGGEGATAADADGGEPGKNEQEIMRQLRDWDLWGPLLVCLLLSILLSLEAPTAGEASSVFAAVFVAVWVGSAIVTINAQLLGGNISFFQSVCVLGYCIFPLDMAALLVIIVRHVSPVGWLGILNLVWVFIGFIWSTRASTVFVGQFITPERRMLAVFPVFFFYTFLGWMILWL